MLIRLQEVLGDLYVKHGMTREVLMLSEIIDCMVLEEQQKIYNSYIIENQKN